MHVMLKVTVKLFFHSLNLPDLLSFLQEIGVSACEHIHLEIAPSYMYIP